MDEKTIARFWSKVDKRGPGECWEWKAHRLPTGYGTVRVAGKMWRAHRFSFEITTGKIPSGLAVCHRCDRPACCNPSHLFLGTHMENMRDRDIKRRGRTPAVRRGEASFSARLREADIHAIRGMIAGGLSYRSIAANFRVCVATIGHIATGLTWKHVHTR